MSLPTNEKDLNLKVPTSDVPDDEFGGRDARQILERKLLLKLDLRMSILVVIYILNYVNLHISFPSGLDTDDESRSTETMLGMPTSPPRIPADVG